MDLLRGAATCGTQQNRRGGLSYSPKPLRRAGADLDLVELVRHVVLRHWNREGGFGAGLQQDPLL